MAANDGRGSLLRGRTDWHRGSGTGTGGRPDRRLVGRGKGWRSPEAVPGPGQGAAFSAAAGSHVRAAAGVEAFAASRHVRLPLRGCPLFATSTACILEGGEIAHAVRYGTVPGTSVRPGHRISAGLESRVRAPSHFSCAGDESRAPPREKAAARGRARTGTGNLILGTHLSGLH